VVDADPNRSIVDWRGGGSASEIKAIGDATESSIIRTTREEAASRQFVFVDLEGTAGRLVCRAILGAVPFIAFCEENRFSYRIG
jgi:chromosome partitioning protein